MSPRLPMDRVPGEAISDILGKRQFSAIIFLSHLFFECFGLQMHDVCLLEPMIRQPSRIVSC